MTRSHRRGMTMGPTRFGWATAPVISIEFTGVFLGTPGELTNGGTGCLRHGLRVADSGAAGAAHSPAPFLMPIARSCLSAAPGVPVEPAASADTFIPSPTPYNTDTIATSSHLGCAAADFGDAPLVDPAAGPVVQFTDSWAGTLHAECCGLSMRGEHSRLHVLRDQLGHLERFLSTMVPLTTFTTTRPTRRVPPGSSGSAVTPAELLSCGQCRLRIMSLAQVTSSVP